MGSRHGHAGAGFVLLLFASARVVMVFSAQVFALFKQLSFMPIREAAPCINRTAAWRFAELSFQGVLSNLPHDQRAQFEMDAALGSK